MQNFIVKEVRKGMRGGPGVWALLSQCLGTPDASFVWVFLPAISYVLRFFLVALFSFKRQTAFWLNGRSLGFTELTILFPFICIDQKSISRSKKWSSTAFQPDIVKTPVITPINFRLASQKLQKCILCSILCEERNYCSTIRNFKLPSRMGAPSP